MNNTFYLHVYVANPLHMCKKMASKTFLFYLADIRKIQIIVKRLFKCKVIVRILLKWGTVYGLYYYFYLLLKFRELWVSQCVCVLLYVFLYLLISWHLLHIFSIMLWTLYDIQSNKAGIAHCLMLLPLTTAAQVHFPGHWHITWLHERLSLQLPVIPL